LDEPKPYDGAVENTDISESRPSLRSTANFLYEAGLDKNLADEDDGHSKDDDLSPDTNTQRGVLSSGRSGDRDRRISPKTKTDFRTRQYCTQACLLTLKRGWDLDSKCPNVSLYRTVDGGKRHAITFDEFKTLVDKQFRRGVYRHCVALDPFGFEGKLRSIGALFKLELAPYGYTFVAKGTKRGHHDCLKHESLVYARLERLQGEVVPVHLGMADLSWGKGYILPGASYVVYMMMLSWGGEVADDKTVPDLAVEKGRLMGALWDEFCCHTGDGNQPSFLWNEEAGCVMAINLDEFDFRLAPKRVLTLASPEPNLSHPARKTHWRRLRKVKYRNHKRASPGSGLRIVECLPGN
jgi:hypothetical protein